MVSVDLLFCLLCVCSCTSVDGHTSTQYARFDGPGDAPRQGAGRRRQEEAERTETSTYLTGIPPCIKVKKQEAVKKKTSWCPTRCTIDHICCGGVIVVVFLPFQVPNKINANTIYHLGGAVANWLRRRTSNQTVLGSNPAVAAALSPWTRLFTPIVPRRSLHISFY